MKCSNCNNKILMTDKFCVHCGIEIDEVTFDKGRDDELLKALIGRKKEKFENKIFSFPTLFLGTIYFMYRKMYVLTAVSFLIKILLLVFLPNISLLFISVINAILACFFNKWYLRRINEKLGEIKKEHKNKTFEEIKKVCYKKGGTTLAPLFIALGLLGIFGITALSVIIKEIINVFDYNSNYAELSYSVPRNFELYSDIDGIYVYKHHSNDCKFTIREYEAGLFLQPQDYLIEKYDDINITLMQINLYNINGFYWAHAKLEEKYGERDIYVTVKNNTIYELTFDTFENNLSCSDSQNELKNSLNFNILENI